MTTDCKNDKKPPEGDFKRSRVDEGLLHSGFYPDSQNINSDAAKISVIAGSSKYFRDYFKFFELYELYPIFFLYFCNVHTHAFGQMGEDSDILKSVIDALFLTV